MIARYVKIAMVLSLALFALIVAFTNVTSYDANYQFVRHVLSMDTTFRDPTVMYRAITAPWAWHLGYAAIIAVEAAVGIVLLHAGWRLFGARHAPAAEFQRAKAGVHVGAGLGFLLWFTGFMVAGGEWFLMWQSQVWNGQEAAFRFYVTLLAVLIYVNQRDAEPEGGR
jgi:predicted small integral membrane protein